MKVQRVRIPDSNKVTWVVLGDDYLPVEPIQVYLEYLQNIERSPNTVRSYAYHLKLYWHYLKDSQLEWTEIGLKELANFISWMRSPIPGVISIQEQVSRRTESTINAIITSVCMFYDYQERIEATVGIPATRSQFQPYRRYKGFLHHITKSKPVKTSLLKLKTPQRIVSTITPREFKRLVNACTRIRDKFLLSLLYESGMRVGQALGLHHQDVQSWDNLVRVVPRANNANGARAKTRSTYTIHISESLMGLYADYLIKEFDEIDSDYVFVNLWDGVIGQPMRYGAIYDLFRRLSKTTEIEVHPYTLRHSHATELIRAGWDAAKVQKRLGHAQVQTVLNTYTHLNDEDLKQAYQEYIEKEKYSHD